MGPAAAGHVSSCSSSDESVQAQQRPKDYALLRTAPFRKHLKWTAASARTSIPLHVRYRGGIWHPRHGEPAFRRELMDRCAALLRCTWTRLPMARIRGEGDKKAHCMEAFASRYAAKLAGLSSKHPEKTLLSVLQHWLSVQQTQGGDGKSHEFGPYRDWKGANRFGWDGFYLETYREMHDITVGAWNECEGAQCG